VLSGRLEFAETKRSLQKEKTVFLQAIGVRITSCRVTRRRACARDGDRALSPKLEPTMTDDVLAKAYRLLAQLPVIDMPFPGA
jgi:hypothetical protein